MSGQTTEPKALSFEDACVALSEAVPDVDRLLTSLAEVDRFRTALFLLTNGTFGDRPGYRASAIKALRELLCERLAGFLHALVLSSEAASVGVESIRSLSPQLSEGDLVSLMKVVIDRPTLAKEASVMWLLGGAHDDRWYRLLSAAGGEALLPHLKVSPEADRIARSLLAGRGGL